MNRPLELLLAFSCAAIAASSVEDEVPLFFIPNRGQAPAPVRYVVKGSRLTAQFLDGEVNLRADGANLTMRYEGANPRHRIEGKGLLSGRANFFTGNETEWRVDLPLFGAVAYRELYPGIDLVYAGSERKLKSEFVVEAGADPAQIRVRYCGAGNPWLDVDGSLVVPIHGEAGKELRELKPVLYQERGGKREVVAGAFLLRGDGTVGFQVGEYDRALALVIDPVLSYGTLLGGSGTDSATALAVDASGAAYIAGFTASPNIPAINPAQSFNGGGNDAFVAKLSPAGNTLIYCSYFGGTGDDRAYGIAVDAQGSAYVAGSTMSYNFPVHAALQPHIAGSRNAFVLKLTPAGNSLVYSTYLGGNALDSANGIATDASGAAYVVGDTTSFSFPATGFQRATRGGQDAFVAKISADGSRLAYSTYLGGSADEHGAAIAVESGGTVYVTGSTLSTDFPVLHAAQAHNAGGQDAFITRLSADGNSILFSTYLGGSGGTVMYPEIAQSIALDAELNAYVTGVTSSTDFPTLNPLQGSLKGALDAFVTKFTSSGTMVYSTYLGGSSVDQANGIAVDAGGAAYVVGHTISTDLPVINAVQSAYAGEYDGFLARLSPAGNVLQYLSYLGGSGSDSATAVALDPSANVYIAGFTLSTDFPTLNSFQTANGGNYSAFLMKVDFTELRSAAVLSIVSSHVGNFGQGQQGARYSLVVSNQALAPATTGTVSVTDTLPSGLTLGSLSGVGWSCTLNTCTRGDALHGGSSYPPITVTVNVASNAGTPLSNAVSVSDGGLSPAGSVDATTIQVASAVVVGNGDFETGSFGAWVPFGSNPLVVSSSIAYTGSYSLFIGVGSGGVYQDIGGLRPGQFYTVTARVWGGSPVGQALLYAHDTRGAGSVTDGPRSPSPSAWNSFAVTFLADSIGKIRIHLMNTSGSGTLYWDDIFLSTGWQSDFESGTLPPWQSYGGATVSLTASPSIGAFSLSLSGRSGGVYQDISGLNAGQFYTVTAHVRSAPGTSGGTLLYLHDTSGFNTAIDGARIPSSGSWETFEAHFLATSSGRIRVHVQFTGGSGAVYFDDIRVVQGWHSGFEGGGLGAWNPFGSGASISSLVAMEGSNSLLESGAGGVFQDIAGLVPGQVYHVIGRAHSSVGTAAQTMLWIHDSTSARIVSSAIKTPSATGWDVFEANFVAGPNGIMRLHLMNLGGSGAIYWDDIEVLSSGGFGFEVGNLTGWGVAGAVIAVANTAMPATGASSLVESGGAGLVYRDVSGFDQGAPYRVSARVRSSPGATGGVTLWVHDTNNGNVVQFGPRVASSTEWETYSVNFKSTATGAARVHLLYNGVGSGASYVDDVEVEKGWYSGFEEGLSGWIGFGSTSSSITSALAYSGQNSAAQTGASGGLFQDVVGLVPGQKYRITARVRTVPSACSGAMLWVHDTTGGNAIQDGPRIPSSDDWDGFGVTFVATGMGAARIHLYDFGGCGGAGTLYWDHVQLTPVMR